MPAANDEWSAIRTPDQRPRVFVSSTLEELVHPDRARSNAASATFGELASRRQSETDGIGDAAA
jgi:hypothetical protein